MTFFGLTRTAATLVALLALTAAASAQTQSAAGDMGSGSMSGINLGGGDRAVDEDTMRKRREIEDAYKSATRSAPAQATAVNDPWANMRGPEEQKPVAKPAAKTVQKKKPAQ